VRIALMVREPSACEHCGISRRAHMQRWRKGVGWHLWMMPSQSKIKARMIRRRKHHAATRWVTR
jgi:hypothetical protein